MTAKSEGLTPVVITETPRQTFDVQMPALPLAVTAGLDYLQVNAINHAVASINHGLGKLLKETAATLVQLKQKVPAGNWLTFLDSKSIPLKAWHCQNLIRANDWLQSNVVTDEQLTTIGYGTIARISASLPVAQKTMGKHAKQAKAVSQMPKAVSPMPKKLPANLKMLKSASKAHQGLQQREQELTKENKSLKAMVHQLKAENDGLKTKLNALCAQA
ncbi:MAG: hypothetical protein AB8E87_11380 [Prochlorococcus sp.]